MYLGLPFSSHHLKAWKTQITGGGEHLHGFHHRLLAVSKSSLAKSNPENIIRISCDAKGSENILSC